MGFSEYEAAKLSQAYWRIDRAAMRDLAQLWVPGQPVHENAAYVARARQLDTDLETALIDVLYDVRPMAAEDTGPGGHPPADQPATDQPPETPASAKLAMPE